MPISTPAQTFFDVVRLRFSTAFIEEQQSIWSRGCPDGEHLSDLQRHPTALIPLWWLLFLIAWSCLVSWGFVQLEWWSEDSSNVFSIFDPWKTVCQVHIMTCRSLQTIITDRSAQQSVEKQLPRRWKELKCIEHCGLQMWLKAWVVDCRELCCFVYIESSMRIAVGQRAKGAEKGFHQCSTVKRTGVANENAALMETEQHKHHHGVWMTCGLSPICFWAGLWTFFGRQTFRCLLQNFLCADVRCLWQVWRGEQLLSCTALSHAHTFSMSKCTDLRIVNQTSRVWSCSINPAFILLLQGLRRRTFHWESVLHKTLSVTIDCHRPSACRVVSASALITSLFGDPVVSIAKWKRWWWHLLGLRFVDPWKLIPPEILWGISIAWVSARYPHKTQTC